jgi:predicted ATPase
VPATVQAVLAARIDRLPPEEKRLLQTAAVVGTDVPFTLLRAIADLPEEALHRGLAHLQAAEFLYEARLFSEPEYTFKHALTHEVAYGSLLLERRRVLHARLVEALKALTPERVDEGPSGAKGLPAGRQDPDQVERLAHHALRGEVWDKAVPYCRQAGARAHDRAAFRKAVAFFEHPLSRPSRTCPRAAILGGWPSRSASLWSARWPYWESTGGASPCWARLRPSPRRSMIGLGWDECWLGWPRYAGLRETTTAP